MKSIKLTLRLELPKAKEACGKKQLPKRSVESKVREALEAIESDEDSYREWKFIVRVYNNLVDIEKRSPKAENLLEMIRPVIEEYGIGSSEDIHFEDGTQHSVNRDETGTPKKDSEYLLLDNRVTRKKNRK